MGLRKCYCEKLCLLIYCVITYPNRSLLSPVFLLEKNRKQKWHNCYLMTKEEMISIWLWTVSHIESNSVFSFVALKVGDYFSPPNQLAWRLRRFSIFHIESELDSQCFMCQNFPPFFGPVLPLSCNRSCHLFGHSDSLGWTSEPCWAMDRVASGLSDVVQCGMWSPEWLRLLFPAPGKEKRWGWHL